MKVALIGARKFPVVEAALDIAIFMRQFPPNTIILTRGSDGFDAFAAECARVMGFEVELYKAKGGASNFERDVRLARDADKVYAFFEADAIGEGGTQHVVDKALDQRKPVESYTAHGRSLVLVGSAGEGDPSDGEEDPRRPTPTTREAPPQLAIPSFDSPAEGGHLRRR